MWKYRLLSRRGLTTAEVRDFCWLHGSRRSNVFLPSDQEQCSRPRELERKSSRTNYAQLCNKREAGNFTVFIVNNN
jgi:hypothetical protein